MAVDHPEDSRDPMPAGKWRELERRMMAMEDLIQAQAELLHRTAAALDKHEAVCIERQKTEFNNFAAVQTLISDLSRSVAAISDRTAQSVTALSEKVTNSIAALTTEMNKRERSFLVWAALSGATSTGTLVIMIITRGLK